MNSINIAGTTTDYPLAFKPDNCFFKMKETESGRIYVIKSPINVVQEARNYNFAYVEGFISQSNDEIKARSVTFLSLKPERAFNHINERKLNMMKFENITA